MATKRKKRSKSTRALAQRPIVQAPLAQLPKEAGDRRALGRSGTVEALFPTPRPAVELSSEYAAVGLLYSRRRVGSVAATASGVCDFAPASRMLEHETFPRLLNVRPSSSPQSRRMASDREEPSCFARR